jgi:hypothetical protein
MNWDTVDWKCLARLRESFLTGTAGASDYWLTDADLVSYDLTFAQRIGWKWDFVLKELARLGWSPPDGAALDWGCGSGIAGRTFAGAFGVREVVLHDRSARAVRYAAERAKEKLPGVLVRSGREGFATLLVSHVLTELSAAGVGDLLALAGQAQSVLWVEPGAHESSRKLIEVRELLRGEFRIVAPCVHAGRCGMLTENNSRHWCHQFAVPPSDVHQTAHWARFAKVTGIDVRSLPVSYLVMDKRPVPPVEPGAFRLIGHPRLYKGYASLLGCDAGGVSERRIQRRDNEDLFQRARKGVLEGLVRAK